MDPGVTWLPFLWKTPIAGTADEVAEAEKQLGIKFPTDFVEAITANQGALPEPHSFDYMAFESSTKRTGTAGALFHLRTGERDALARYNIVSRVNEIRSVGGRKTLIPFCEETTRGNYVCLDYGEDESTPRAEPTVVVLDFELMVTSDVAESFMDFLVALYDNGPLNKSHVTEDGDDEDDEVVAGSSEDYACNECLGLIEGVRWHCEECFEYDVCDACMRKTTTDGALVLAEGDEHKKHHKLTKHAVSS